MNSKRRNGKLASCEPCRKDKVRCDHRSPVCSRCQRRRIASRCFYHPAPLTRGVTHESPRELSQATISTRSLHSPAYTTTDGTSPCVDDEPNPSSRGGFYTPSTGQSTGYLGPISFVASFEEDQARVFSPNDRHDYDKVDMISNLPALLRYWVDETKKVLGYLKDFPIMEQLVREYYSMSESAPIPGPLVLNALDEVIRQTPELDVELIIRNTAQAFDVSSNIQGRDFHTLFTGPNLRLEAIGLIYCIAGLANIFFLPHEKSSGRHRLEWRLQFARRMLAASDTIIQACKLLTPVNDLMIWVVYENVLLSTVVHGDYSSTKWHRLGELTTHMFELGLHREPQQPSSFPTFLLETRRRIFAATYQLDKSIVTFLGRPPRISWRHSDCKLPLDINDEALLSDEGIELASRSLTSDGWSVHPVLQRSALIRLRFQVSLVREEILELSMQAPSEETADKLRDVCLRCHQTWNELPAHLRYTPSCWDEDIPFAARLMLIAAYLIYLHNHFLIQRLLVQQDATAQAALLDVSSTLLSTVLAFETRNEHLVDIQRDSVWIILLYGFPSAGVLIKALQKHARTGQPSLEKGLKPRLIRDLSVFVSRLESISRMGMANHELFARASKLLSNILDEVLESGSSNVPIEMSFPDLLDTTIDGLGGLEDINFDAVEFGGVYDQWIF